MSTEYYRTNSVYAKPNHLFGFGLGLMMAAFAVTLVAVLLASDFSATKPLVFIIPWVLVLAVVFAVPLVVMLYRGIFTFYDPIVFATFSYLFPAFVLGGIILAFGWSEPYFLSFIQDTEVNFPLSIELIALGFLGLISGYFLPVGKMLGARISNIFPGREPDARFFIVPGFVLLFVGMFNSYAATVLGIIGYQRPEEISIYDGLIFLTTLFWMQASFVLWFVIFKDGRLTPGNMMIASILLITSIVKALYAGNRGGLLHISIIVGLAYLLSGRQLNFRKSVAAVVLVSSALMVGMIYGTTFRLNKGDESAAGIESYTSDVLTTLDHVSKTENMAAIEFGITNLAERIDVLSSVAVVVSNYEQLQPYEESYGLDNNITKDLSTFFIPRILWNDKPVASEPRTYSDLYFNYPDNSFAITPIADLLRNFGVWGIFPGMLALGIILRMLYRALVEDQPRMLGRSVLYFMLLTSVSYEGFYGAIIPYMVKVGVIAVIGIIPVVYAASRIEKSSLRSSF